MGFVLNKGGSRYTYDGPSSAPAYYNLPGAIPMFSQVGVFDSYAANWAVSIGASTWNIFASSANIQYGEPGVCCKSRIYGKLQL